MNDIKYPLYNDPLFAKAKRVDDYEKIKNLHRSVCKIIERLDDKISVHGNPKNPRQDVLQFQDTNNFRLLQRQKLHLEEKMKVLEESIKKDMENEL
jgi:hypothetical protein